MRPQGSIGGVSALLWGTCAHLLIQGRNVPASTLDASLGLCWPEFSVLVVTCRTLRSVLQLIGPPGCRQHGAQASLEAGLAAGGHVA